MERKGTCVRHLFYPDHYVASAYEIPYSALYAAGKRALIFDIDNTLVEHGAPADGRAIALMKQLRESGFSVCFLSNNKEPRVRLFNEPIQAQYVFRAKKPSRAGYEAAMVRLGSTRQTTVFIGDQIFTDIWGANRCGLETFLTKPISRREEPQIVLKRLLEKPVLFFYRRWRKKQGRSELKQK